MAEEKFKDVRLTGSINVTCKFKNGTVRYWRTTKEEVISDIQNVVQQYGNEGYILTLRQLHYQLVKANLIVNHIRAYKKLGEILDDCKYSGIIDWDAFEDRTRVPYIPYSVDGVDDALQDTIDQYRLNRQHGQKEHIELWTEKDALSGILKRTTEKYHIQLVVNKGYTSSSALYEAYHRVINNLRDSKTFTILYFGDHDPSGLDMIRDIRGRLTMMITKGKYKLPLKGLEDWFQVVPIGLNMQQIKKYKLPPNPTKLTDTRSDKYVKLHGPDCWEVDALDPPTLTAIVEKNITERIDILKYEKMIAKENKGIKELQKFINSHNNKN